ncbi:MAG: type II toxin-antitoxin system RelE/ParE family toxin [Bacteroidales bacterium]|nr:type II toxin-antitoxin system RelE/ParE family toxin [Bacteroidales bacterium]MBQ8839639.1 type II toxin-antitoxin system RelE/ParE family toxin [Bacteroidales bacterium]
MKKILAYKDYYVKFMKGLPERDRQKIRRSLLLMETEDKIPRHYIKYIRDGVYEFRVTSYGNEYRLFYIYDGDTIVILLNGYLKKTKKALLKEIEKALRLKKEYYENK